MALPDLNAMLSRPRRNEPARLALPAQSVGFRIANVVAIGAAGTGGNCKVRVVTVRMLDTTYPQTAGIQTVTALQRRTDTFYAAAPTSLTLAAGDMVELVQDAAGQWWVLKNLGACAAGSPSASGSAGSSGSCTQCPTSRCFDLLAAGFTNGTCSTCSQYNGTFRLTAASGVNCRWRSSVLNPACGGGAQFAWTLEYSSGSGNWIAYPIQGAAQPTFSIAGASWNCTGANTLTFASAGSGECNVPGSVSVTEVAC